MTSKIQTALRLALEAKRFRDLARVSGDHEFLRSARLPAR